MLENKLKTQSGLLSQRLANTAIVTFAICILCIFFSSLPVRSQHKPLQYHGGPVLRSFKIYPLYYGNWSSDDVTAQQNYLEGLARYLSGKDEPADQQPVTWQYGVNEASVAPAETDNSNATPRKLSAADIQNIIKTNQNNNKLPAFNSNTLIIVFPAHGFGLTYCDGCGFHNAESSSAFWAVVPQDAGVGTPIKGPIPEPPGPQQLVICHEVLEAALDPAIDYSLGWDECVDGCLTVWYHMAVPGSIYRSVGYRVPPITLRTDRAQLPGTPVRMRNRFMGGRLPITKRNTTSFGRKAGGSIYSNHM